MTDRAGGADAAWAAADTLHMAARALRSPALRQAADAYDRAASRGAPVTESSCATPPGRSRGPCGSPATQPGSAGTGRRACGAGRRRGRAAQGAAACCPAGRCPPGRRPIARSRGQSSRPRALSSPRPPTWPAKTTSSCPVPVSAIWPYRPRALETTECSAAPQQPPAQAESAQPRNCLQPTIRTVPRTTPGDCR
jgi:hypothetical protein